MALVLNPRSPRWYLGGRACGSGRAWGCGRGGAAGAGFGLRGEEKRGQLLVGGEEVFDAFAVGVEGFGAVAFLDGAIGVGVGLGERGGHGQQVVKIGQRVHPARLGSAGFQPALSGILPESLVLWRESA